MGGKRGETWKGGVLFLDKKGLQPTTPSEKVGEQKVRKAEKEQPQHQKKYYQRGKV